MSSEEDHALVAAALASMPPPDVPADFVARVNARIDETSGLLGLADFRAWTLRLAPLAAGLALIMVLWPETSATPATPATVQESRFSPTSATDWQQDVSADALLAAALTRADHAR